MKKNLQTLKILSVLFFFSVSCFNARAYYKVVAKDGSGDYTTVQAAIDAAPTTATASNQDTIFIKNGRYKEKITIPSNKPFIQLLGESVAGVVLTYDDYGGKLVTCNTTVGTQNSASVTVNANDFTAINITFENSHVYGTPDNNNQQAVAILVNADRAAFKNCRFIGNQDTMYLKGTGTVRDYFKNCYIDGLTDYIFGSSIALFDSCVLYNKNRTGIASSYMTAANTLTGQAYGFVFRNCKIGGNDGGTQFYLGRPWQNNPKVVYINATIINYNNILPAGWSTTSAGSATFADSYFAEYKTKKSDGTLADVSQRTAGSHQLTDADTVGYNIGNMFSGWDPCAVYSGFCNSSAAPIAVSNFTGVKGTSSSQFNWNISWPMAGIQYSLYRSIDGAAATSIYTTTALTDTAVNFTYTDATIPPQGSVYSYFVTASKAGFASHTTDTVKIVSTPLLTVNASDALFLCGFSQALGTPSASQAYTIAGSNLTNNITVTPPVNYEVSLNQTNWFTNASPLTITQSGGTVATTTIYVRLNASSSGSYSGNIVNASTGAASINVAVTGNTVPAPTSFLLKEWPLTQNNDDSSGVRSAGVTRVTTNPSTLNNLYTSDGSSASANIIAYSGQYGQALGANPAGNNWSAIGGNLNRAYYEQFKVTAATGYTVRVDSITFLSDFYLTTSNIKMGCVFSKNGFTPPADSTEFSNGVGPGGALVISASGNFAKSFPLLRQDNGPIDYYSLALNGTTGVTLNAGESIYIRLYWACSSAGTPRFAFLKNVSIKGLATAGALPLTLVSFNAVLDGSKVKATWATNNERNVRRFTLQRSNDANNFVDVGSVDAKNYATQNDYLFNDVNPLQGVSYYRSKIEDVDGSVKYSTVVSINNFKDATLSIYPNPVKDNLFVNHPKSIAGATIEVYAADGRMVNKQTVTKDATQTNVNTATLSYGSYHLVFINGNDVQHINFIKK